MGTGGGVYPSHPYHYDHYPYPRPSVNPFGYSTYPAGMNYGRGYPPVRPYHPMPFGPAASPMYPNPMFGRGSFGMFRNGPTGGLQSAPPSGTADGNIQLNRPGEHRPHFDEQ